MCILHRYTFARNKSMSMLGILIDTLSKKKNKYRTGGVHLVPLESLAGSSTTTIIQIKDDLC